MRKIFILMVECVLSCSTVSSFTLYSNNLPQKNPLLQHAFSNMDKQNMKLMATNNLIPQLTVTTTVSKTLTAASLPNKTVLTQIKSILSALANASKGTGPLLAFQQLLINTHPMIYFSCLMLAGVGVPLSEDALCIFVGSILNEKGVEPVKLIAALYFGVVISDVISFSIGKAMGKGLAPNLSKRLQLRTKRIDFCEEEENELTEKELEMLSPEELERLQNEAVEEDALCEIPTPKLRAKDNVLAILEKVGDYVGFFVRFSIGMRLPMMIAAGFSGKVRLSRFVIGTTIGAVFSLSIQLLLGHLLRNNTALILAVIAALSTFPLLMPTLFAFGSWLNIMYLRWSMYNKAEEVES